MSPRERENKAIPETKMVRAYSRADFVSLIGTTSSQDTESSGSTTFNKRSRRMRCTMMEAYGLPNSILKWKKHRKRVEPMLCLHRYDIFTEYRNLW